MNERQLEKAFLDEKTETMRLQRELNTAAVRMQILVDRMAGCNDQALEEGRAPTHELIDESRMFVEETKRAARDGGR